jgi:bifunctional UDP-N-acetylglucosamine pyrophosphorylase / glucosamine-1-phosphate N-acetyltransferase
MTLSVVILAAGNGKRMQSSLPKVLHHLGGMPLLVHVVKTAQTLNPETIYVVYGHGGEQVRASLPDLRVNWIEQTEAKGTGHALLQVVPKLQDTHRILVLYGDVPLIKSATLQDLMAATHCDQVGLLVAKIDNPNGFGRIIRNQNNDIIAIVEHKDASSEQLNINEINTGILTAPVSSLKKWLPQLKNKNAQSEYYLTDVITFAIQEHVKVISTLAKCNKEIHGINDRQELMFLERHYQLQKSHELLLQGVSIIDPMRFDCRGTANIAKDVQIDINVILEGNVSIDEGTYIGPNTILKNVRIGKNVIIKSNSSIEEAVISDNCIIGPFANIRPNTYLAEGVHVGNFVELKNTQIGLLSKVNHLSYLGDAKVGSHVNVGAGTITCNYDGKNKFETVIKDNAFIGSGTQLVAPVTIGEQAYIGAGSTITKDAPARQLTLGRAKQITLKEWKKNE